MNSLISEKDLIQDFLDLSAVNRLDALKEILTKNEITYELDEGKDYTNVLVSMTDERKYILLVAHYDVYRNSKGINDNTAAIAVLINVIKALQNVKDKLPFKVLFTDKEETGMLGSAGFARKHDNEIYFAIILDIVGFGDRLLGCSKIPELFDFLNDYNIDNTDVYLPSDNAMFNAYDIANTLIVAVHNEDLRIVKNEGVETLYILEPNPKFYQSFHNRELDNKLEIINFDLLLHLRESLIKLMELKK